MTRMGASSALGLSPTTTNLDNQMTYTDWAVVDWGEGRQTLLDRFETYREASCCAHEFNSWAKTQAGDHFATVEPIEVEL